MVIEIQDSVVMLSGLLRSNQWPAIMAAARLALQTYPHGIVIDCADLNCAGASGVQTFVAAFEHIEATELPIIIAHLPENTARELDLVMDGRSHQHTNESADAIRITQAIYSDLWWERLWR